MKITFLLILTFILTNCSSNGSRRAERQQKASAEISAVADPIIYGCYLEAYKKNSNLVGIIHLDWDIDKLGNAHSISFRKDSMQTPELKKCIITGLEKASFPVAAAAWDGFFVNGFKMVLTR